MHVLKPNKRTTVATLLNTGSVAASSSTPATGSGVEIAPRRPPAIDSGPQSLCEPHRVFIEAQLRLRRSYTAIYQDMVDQFGFAGRYSCTLRYSRRCFRRVAWNSSKET